MNKFDLVTAQDVYSSNYRADNESSTDEDDSQSENESSDDDDFKSRIGKIATRTSAHGKVRISASREPRDDDDEDDMEEEEDEFEAEMKKEMEERMLQAEKDASIANNAITLEPDLPDVEDMAEDPGGSTSSSAQASGSATDQTKSQEKYDDIYFDSDEEGGEDGGGDKRKVQTNEDLLYDPNMDEDDQNWVDDVRRSYQIQDKNKDKSKNPKPLPNSDAVLNCPACFTVVCLDCQRHELYKTQYRAMFVINCSVITDEKLRIPLKKQKGKKGRVITHPDQEYHPVRCDQCKTELAMYDTDEVYHFFNVVASHS